jgi:hypothetical protein
MSRAESSRDYPILGLGSIAVGGELRPLLLIEEYLFPLFPRERASWSVAGFQARRPWKRIRVEDCVVTVSESLRHGDPYLVNLLKTLEPPSNTVIAFITDPSESRSTHPGFGVRLGGGGNGTLGAGFALPDGKQLFSTAGHVVAQCVRFSTTTPAIERDVRLVRKHFFGLVSAERPFGQLTDFRERTNGAADICLISPFEPVRCIQLTAVANPVVEMELCTVYGAKSGTRPGWKAGSVSEGILATQWPHSWFAMSRRLSGLADQGDSGARVHDSAGRLVGHVVATAGMRTLGGTVQSAIVQDIAFQRIFAERELGLPVAATLVVAT